jgi:hypothetical protein
MEIYTRSEFHKVTLPTNKKSEMLIRHSASFYPAILKSAGYINRPELALFNEHR